MKYFNSLSILLAGVILLMSCQDPSFPTPEISTTVRYAKVLFINASPDAQGLVYQVNNAQVATLNPQNTSGYLNVNASTEQLRIKNAVFGVVSGDTLAQKADLEVKDSKTLLPTTTSLVGGGAYTVIITDSLNRPHAKKSSFNTDQGGLQILNLGPIRDDLAATPGFFGVPASSAGVRFYNLAPGAATVYLSNGGTAMSTLSTGKAYRAMTNTFTNIAPGNYTLQVSTTSVSGTVLTTLNVALSPGKVYTVFLTGKVVNSVVKVPYALNLVQHN